MNTDISHVRNSLLLKIAVALMFLSLVGHPICEFNPENYVKENAWKGITPMQTTLFAAHRLQGGHTKWPRLKIYGKISKGM